MSTIDAETLKETRELLADLRAASADARTLADHYAELLKTAVDSYCLEFDKRAKSLQEQLGDPS